MGALAAQQERIPLPGSSRTSAALVARESDFGDEPNGARQEETSQLRVEEVEAADGP